MIVKTKYSIGQKVYYKNYNREPDYGHINQIKIIVDNHVYVSYRIGNRTGNESDVPEEIIFEDKKDLEDFFVEQVKKKFNKW